MLAPEDAWLAPILTATLLGITLPWLSNKDQTARAALIAVTLAFMVRYLTWRFSETLPPTAFSVEFLCGAIFLTVETLATLSTASSLVFLVRTKSRSEEATRNLSWLQSLPTAPLVDVLICTYNEERVILERTVAGAMGLDYARVRVWVCDDGRRPWLRELCEEANCRYLTRPDNAHAKAGNINAALAHLSGLDERPDFVMILDADFIAAPNFLTRALPLFRDERVAVVQTPQHFVNSDPIQTNLAIAAVWPDEQRYFFDELLASKDAWGVAFCCGTSSVLRYSAIQSIGGFPTDSVTEDYLLSIRLRQAGQQTVYLNEPLSFGLAPEGLAEYVTQRTRWCLGFMQICRGRSSPWKLGNNLALLDRINLTETFLYWSATHMFRVLGLVVPLLYFYFDIAAIRVNLTDTLIYFAPYFIVHIVVMAWLTRGRVIPILTDISQLIAADQVLRAVYAGLMRPVGQKFKVTAKGGDRSRRAIQWSVLTNVLIYIGLTIGGIVYAFALDVDRSLDENGWVALWWCWYNFVLLSILALIAVEMPRHRKAERLDTQTTAVINAGAGWESRALVDLSLTGAQFVGTAPVGQMIRIKLAEHSFKGVVVRSLANSFAVKFAQDQTSLRRLISLLYSGTVGETQTYVRFWTLIQALWQRIMRQ